MNTLYHQMFSYSYNLWAIYYFIIYKKYILKIFVLFDCFLGVVCLVFFLIVLFYFLWEKISLFNFSWLGTHYVHQADLTLWNNLPTSASWMMGLYMYTIMPCPKVAFWFPLLKMFVVSLLYLLMLKLTSIQENLFLFRFLDNLAM